MVENKFDFPLVSVIIPTYKRSKMLSRAIESVLSQDYKNIQIIVVDDNDPKTDYRNQTEELMQKYQSDYRVKYIKHQKNLNGAAARNTGINNSDGKLIAFLDDDDFFYKNKISLQVSFLQSNPNFKAVYCGWKRNGRSVTLLKEGDLSFEILSGKQLIYTNTILMWKEAAIKCGGWDESFRRHQEAAFLLRYFKIGEKIGVIKEVLVEFDTTDRSNAAKTSLLNEEYTVHYLNTFKDLIYECEKKRKGALKDIYIFRYRGLLLSHLKTKDYKNAFRIYFTMIKKMPIKFNLSLLKYCIERVGK